MQPTIPYARQSINEEDAAAVAEALRAPLISRGPKLEQFEEAVAAYCGASYAVAFNSGSSALAAAYFAGGATKHDRIVTSPNSFAATVTAGMRWGAEPLFIDIDLKSGNIDLEQLEYNVDYASSRGRNIYLPVHFAGVPVDMERLEAMISDPDALVIEDGAHAFGSSYKCGAKVGSCLYSQMTVFSFHPVKNITCAEGGLVTTNDPALCHRLRLYRNNGIERHQLKEPAPWYYEVQEATGNFFMNELQAALGLSQLKRVDLFAERKRALMARYRSQLAGLPQIRLLEPGSDERHIAYHLFVVLIDFAACNSSRTKLMEELKEQGIGSQLHYIPLYRHPLFGARGSELAQYFPQMEEYYAQALSLPLYYDLADEEADTVVQSLKERLVLQLQ